MTTLVAKRAGGVQLAVQQVVDLVTSDEDSTGVLDDEAGDVTETDDESLCGGAGLPLDGEESDGAAGMPVEGQKSGGAPVQVEVVHGSDTEPARTGVPRQATQRRLVAAGEGESRVGDDEDHLSADDQAGSRGHISRHGLASMPRERDRSRVQAIVAAGVASLTPQDVSMLYQAPLASHSVQEQMSKTLGACVCQCMTRRCCPC